MAGKSFKTLVTFTAGEWGEELFPRTDLDKSASAGRKVRNFIVVQYGRLVRRPGLEFIVPTIIPETEP